MVITRLHFVKSKLKEWNKVSFRKILRKERRIYFKTQLALMLVNRKGINLLSFQLLRP